MATTTTSEDLDHDHAHDGHAHDDHHELSFVEKYIFSTDHKVIGIQYGITSLLFLAFGFFLMMVMRWSIAYPNQELPVVAQWILSLFGTENFLDENGAVTGTLYNMFGAMHGTIMVFLGVVPLGFAAFGNFVTPLQIGAPDMAFPRLNMWSYWLFLAGGLVMFASFWLPSGAAQTRLDQLLAPGHPAPGRSRTAPALERPEHLADRDGPHHFLLAVGSGQFHHHDHQPAVPRDDLDAPALLHLGDAGHRLPVASCLSSP